jgi:hypothetical protein
VLLFAGSLLAGAAAFITMSTAIALVTDLPPRGPTCDYELDPGSGFSGTSNDERVEWGLVPTRVCVYTLTDRDGSAYTGTYDGGYGQLGSFLLACLTGLVAAVAFYPIARWLVVRRKVVQ